MTRLAKWKTTIQMVALGVLIVGDRGVAGLPYGIGMLPVGIIGWTGLWAAGLLTLKTGFDYTRAGLAHIRQMDAP